jgi:hypothetical protein
MLAKLYFSLPYVGDGQGGVHCVYKFIFYLTSPISCSRRGRNTERQIKTLVLYFQYMTSQQPREFITYLGYTISYLVVAISFIIFSFSFVNILLPEIGSYTGLGYGTVFGSLGVFTTSVLVFLAMVYVILCLVGDKKTHPDSKPRMWILQIGMFIGFVVLAITMATLIKYFFSGEITIRFLIKTALVLLVGIDAVLFFRHESAKTVDTPKWISLGASIGATIVMITGIVATFVCLGTPNIARAIRYDQQRTNDLQSLQSTITNWYQSHGALPETLATLKKQDYYQEPRDPEYLKGNVYTYQVIDAKKLQYQVCADFTLASDNKFVIRKDRAEFASGRSMAPMPVAYDETQAGIVSETSLENQWDHSAGKHCFDRVIDTKLYPVYNNEVKR